MSTPLPPSFVVSSPAWWRGYEFWLDTARRRAAAARNWLAQRRAARRRAAFRAALQHLSPHMLRDIGAPDDLVADAMVRDATSQHQRAVVLRGE